MGIPEVKSNIKTLLLEVSGIGTVNTYRNIKPRRAGNLSFFNNPNQEGAAHWEIHVRSVMEESAGIGPQLFRYYTTEIEGWMKASDEPDTSLLYWDPLLESVATKLRENKSLRDSINTVQDVNIIQNDFADYNDGTGLVLCHYCKIALRVREHVRYTTT